MTMIPNTLQKSQKSFKRRKVKNYDLSRMLPDMNPMKHLWSILKWKTEQQKLSSIKQLK